MKKDENNLLNDYSSGHTQDVSVNNEEVEKKEEGSQKQNSQDVDISRYKDIEGLTLKKLNWGLWYVEHKKDLL